MAIISSKSSYSPVPAMNALQRRGRGRGEEMQWGSGGRLDGGRAWLSSHMGEGEKKNTVAAAKKLREEDFQDRKRASWRKTRTLCFTSPARSRRVSLSPFRSLHPPLHSSIIRAEPIMRVSIVQHRRVWRLLTFHPTGFSSVPYNQKTTSA